MTDNLTASIWEDSRLRGYLGAINRRCGIVETLALPTMRDLPPVKIETLFVPPLLSIEAVNADVGPGDWPQGRSLFEELEKSPRLILLGDPGGGKTTLSNWVAWRLTSGLASPLPKRLTNIIPLTCVLREMPAESFKEDLNICGLASHLARKLLGDERSEIIEPVLHEWISRGKFILILDGIDEIPVQSRSSVAKWIREARDRDACVLATSRIVGYQDFPVDSPSAEISSLKEVADKIKRRLSKVSSESSLDVDKVTGAWAEIRYLMPFDKNQISDFVRNWYRQRCTSDHEAKARTLDLLGALNDSEVTSKLARTPNLLSLMAVVHRERAHLPDGKALLYEEIVNAYLNTIDSQRKIVQDDILGGHTWRDKKSWLSYVGYMMQQTRLGYSQEGILVSEKKVISWLVKAMRKSKVSDPEAMAVEFLAWVARRSGLLLPRGEGYYAFVHLSFQEYFCACYIETAVVSPAFFSKNSRVKSDATPAEVAEWASKATWLETLVFVFEILSNERNDSWVNSLVSVLFPSYPKYSPASGSLGLLAARLLTNKHVKLEKSWVNYLADVSCSMVHALADDPVTDGTIASFAALGFALIIDEREDDRRERKSSQVSSLDVLDVSNVRMLIVRSSAEVTSSFLSKFERLCILDCEGLELIDISGCSPKYLSSICVKNANLIGCEIIADCKRLDTLNLVQVNQKGLEEVNGNLGVVSLTLSKVNLASVNFIAGWKKLDNVELYELNVDDFSPLGKLRSLSYVSINKCPVKDVGFLSSCRNLDYVTINNCPVEYIPPLRSSRHLSVGFSNLNITSLSFLSDVAYFNGGVIEGCPIVSLEGLKVSRASYLHLSNLPLKSFEGIERLQWLRSLILRDINVSDLGPLSSLKLLTGIKLERVPVRDFKWAYGLNKLQTLLFSEIEIKDASELLKVKSLREVYVSESDSVDLTAVRKSSKFIVIKDDDYFK